MYDTSKQTFNDNYEILCRLANAKCISDCKKCILALDYIYKNECLSLIARDILEKVEDFLYDGR